MELTDLSFEDFAKLDLDVKMSLIKAKLEEEETKVGIEKARQEAREQNARSLESARGEKENQQKLCPHRKPNGKSAIAGQKKRKKIFYICQYCQQEYDEITLPPELDPNKDFANGCIGGDVTVTTLTPEETLEWNKEYEAWQERIKAEGPLVTAEEVGATITILERLERQP